MDVCFARCYTIVDNFTYPTYQKKKQAKSINLRILTHTDRNLMKNIC